MLFTADASLNLSMLYGGYFPVACVNLRDKILPQGTFANNLVVKVVKIVSSQDCKQLLCLGQVSLPQGNESVPQGQFLVNVDTRVISSRVLENESMRRVYREFPVIEENIKFMDAKVDACKAFWKTFHMQYCSVINLLKPPSVSSPTKNQKPQTTSSITQELIDLIIKGKMTPNTLKFLTEELYGFKTLQRLDENCMLVLTNIQEEVSDKLIPTAERTLQLLSNIRGLIKAKQL